MRVQVASYPGTLVSPSLRVTSKPNLFYTFTRFTIFQFHISHIPGFESLFKMQLISFFLHPCFIHQPLNSLTHVCVGDSNHLTLVPVWEQKAERSPGSSVPSSSLLVFMLDSENTSEISEITTISNSWPIYEIYQVYKKAKDQVAERVDPPFSCWRANNLGAALANLNWERPDYTKHLFSFIY